jgi:ABC-type molybdate transport system substrate-binding protein
MGISIQFNEKPQILWNQDYQTSVTLYASGILRGALSEIAQAFSREHNISIKIEFDHSALLQKRLLNGEHSDIFVSVDMENPTVWLKANKSSPVVNFIRNKMCAIVKPSFKVTPNNLLDWMLNPEIRLGTSTPNEDASGDYAQEIFRKAEKVQPGSFHELNQKALRLVGGRNSPVVPKGKNEIAYFITETQQVDIFLSYRTDARLAVLAAPSMQIVELPEHLAVKANYGMTLMNNARSYGVMLAMYILSQNGQQILTKYGFDSPLILEN